MCHPWFPTRKASKLTFICFQLQLLNTMQGLNIWSWKEKNASFEASFPLCHLNLWRNLHVYVPKVCTSTKVFKSGFVKFCSYKKDLNLSRNLHAFVHACNGTKLFSPVLSNFVQIKKTLFSICTYATKLCKSDLVNFCSNKKKSFKWQLTK